MKVYPACLVLSRPKLIWRQCIPPSKSFIIWRVIHNKMPTKDNLWRIGCIVVSIFSLCGTIANTTSHIFFNCSYCKCLWSWLSDILKLHVDSSEIVSVLSICNRNWSSQALEVVVAGIINVLGIIWYSRNQAKFNSRWISMHSAKVLVI